MASIDMNYLVTGTPPGRAGNAHQNIVPYQVFDCADAPLILAVGNDCAVRALLRSRRPHRVAGRPAFRDQHRARAPSRRGRAADRRADAHAHAARLAGAAGGGRRALRADQSARPGVRRSAGDRARHAHRHAASAGRLGAAGRQPAQVLGDAGRVYSGTAFARRAHARRAFGAAGTVGCRARRTAASGVIELRELRT